MSALEAVNETEQGQTETAQTETVQTGPGLMETMFAARVQQNFTVTINVRDDGEYSAVVTPSYFSVPKGALCEMTFTVDPNSPEGTMFQDPPVVFFGGGVPALTMPRLSEKMAKLLWSNIDPAVQGRSFDYRVRLRIGDKAVTHDPTVQNDPPPPPTFP